MGDSADCRSCGSRYSACQPPVRRTGTLINQKIDLINTVPKCDIHCATGVTHTVPQGDTHCATGVTHTVPQGWHTLCHRVTYTVPQGWLTLCHRGDTHCATMCHTLCHNVPHTVPKCATHCATMCHTLCHRGDPHCTKLDWSYCQSKHGKNRVRSSRIPLIKPTPIAKTYR